MFKGFNIKYPEYEIITPQTGWSINVRTMNVQEEERLKGSILTPSSITEHLNRCIYETITKKPQEITDFDSFLRKITLKDRDALLYGLYHITYEDIRNYEISCGACKKSYAVTIKASTTFNLNPYPNKDILTKKVTKELPISKGVFVTLRQPTLFDELTIMKTVQTSLYSMDLITETLIINSFQQNQENGDSVVYSERDDIINAYKQLPALDKREIYKIYRDEFGQYGINLKMRSTCVHCQNQEEVDIDLVQNFFRMVYSI
jgi:hypothetical protein